ncbi:MAG: DUF1501 domain-containing protein [Gemmataceae bacterium]|nr:DUF1501 domain-containing protein [Gemmataceae bacterium]
MLQIRKFDRRQMVQYGMGLAAMGGAAPGFLFRTAQAAQAKKDSDSILVVVQLSGGNDGLSTVIPFQDPAYHNARKATRLDPKDVLRLNDDVGLHPNLKDFKGFYDQGKLAVIQGVGYPNPNQSHFTSMDIWHSGEANTKESPSPSATSGLEGWLGKYCDVAYPDKPDSTLAIAVGFNQTPRAIQSRRHGGLAVQGQGGFRLFGNTQDKARVEAMERLSKEKNQPGNSSLDFITRTIVDAVEAGKKINTISGNYRTPVVYPFNIPLAAALRTVASLIAGGASTRVYYVYQDGYDTHAGQKARHDKLMADLNQAVGAFSKDMERLEGGKKVLLMTMSEFGRRVEENGSQGTDHGTAAPMFLIGAGVKGGVSGKHPGLKKEDLYLGRDLQFHSDFRAVYATVLEKWLKTPSKQILGKQFPLLECLG